jgi:hypothetical protein
MFSIVFVLHKVTKSLDLSLRTFFWGTYTFQKILTRVGEIKKRHKKHRQDGQWTFYAFLYIGVVTDYSAADCDASKAATSAANAAPSLK